MSASTLASPATHRSGLGLRALAGVVLVFIALYGCVLGWLWWSQERLLFHPAKLASDHRFSQGSDVHESWIDVPGARLSALHLRLPNPDGVVLFLHGNAGSLESWFINSDFYRRANFDLFMIDYRGYGKSSGQIENQAQLEADVRQAWSVVAPQYAGKKRVIYGRSLGTGLAAILAAQAQPDLTILVSPYFSMSDLARKQYPWVPDAVLRYPFRTDLALPRIKGRVLLVHGVRDDLINPSNSQRLQALSPRARLLLVPEAGHGDIHQFPQYLDGLRAALTQP